MYKMNQESAYFLAIAINSNKFDEINSKLSPGNGLADFGGGTGIEDGLETAIDHLILDPISNSKIVVLFTDGVTNSRRSSLSLDQIVNKAIQNNTAITGNLGVAYNGENGYRATAGLSSGFRSPNVDDLTKVFDTKTGYVVVPNKDLKPEYTYNAEINLSHTGNIASWGASVFYTWFNNAIVVSKYNWNGQDNIMYQNVLSAVYAPQNQASAKLYGFNLNGKIKLFYNALLQGTYTYTKGTYNNGTTSMPLDHIPPAYGRIGLKKGGDKFNVEGFILFNGWKRIRDYNLNGEDNEIYATADGMPSWMTVNFSSYYNPSKKLSLGLQIENIADKNYRYFASGISAVGRNFILSCRLSF